MRIGTPGFSGDRLKEAREIRGLQAVVLAELVKVSPQAISQYETGRSSPSPDVLTRLSTTLSVREHFFTLPRRITADRRIFFRSLAAATKGARARAGRRLVWLEDLVDFLAEDVSLPPATLPDLDLPDHHLISSSDIEAVAEEVRKSWGLRDNPIPNVVRLLESKGAILARDFLGDESLDSLSEFDDWTSRPYILIGTDKGTAVRWRYDAAHELGHILLHRGVDRRSLAIRPEFKMVEDQAHRFAGAFLLPLSSFGEDFFAASLDAMRTLKPKWKTSIATMMVRAHQTSMISDETYHGLWKKYNRRGWRRNEPLDEELEPELPVVLRRAFELLQEHVGDAVEDASVRTGIEPSDIQTLSGLPLGRRAEPVVALRPPQSNVVPFKRDVRDA